MAYAASCVQRAQHYFAQKMTGELKNLVEVFKAAKLFWLQRVVEICPTAAVVDSLQFRNNVAVIEGLKGELPQYLALAADTLIEN